MFFWWWHVSSKSPRKQKRKQNHKVLLWVSSVAKLRGRAIYQLNWAYLHQRGWSNNACSTTNATATASWACVDLDSFLEQADVGWQIVGTTSGLAVNNSLHDTCPRLKIVCNSFHGNEIAAPVHRRACANVSVFVVVGVAELNKCPELQCMQVCTLHRCFWHQRTHLRTHSLQGVHMRSCMCSLFVSFGGRGWGGLARQGFFSCKCVCLCVCVYV